MSNPEAGIRLRELLREANLRPGDKLPGERELADRLGVGRTALRPLLEALEMQGIVERRPQSGTFLLRIPAPGAHGSTIALIAPFRGTGNKDSENDAAWLHRVASAFERTATPAGARVVLIDQSEHLQDPCSVVNLAMQASADGADAVVLLHAYGTRTKVALALALMHDRCVHPVVVSSRSYSGLANQVYFDSGWGAYLATRYLIQKGHSHIGFAGAPAGHEWLQERLAGFESALDASELTFNPNWVFLPDQTERLSAFIDGSDAWQRWNTLPMDQRPTAMVAANDVVALGLLDAAKKDGAQIPDQLSVVGFDNDPGALLAGLTTMERPTEALGETAAQVSLERIAAGPAGAAVTVRLRPVLIERQTVSAKH